MLRVRRPVKPGGPDRRQLAATDATSSYAWRMRNYSFALILLLAASPAPAQKLDTEAAAACSKQHAGLAVLVYKKNKLVFERYQNGHTPDKTQHLFSGTKSFAPMVALIAQKERLLDLDEKVCKTITEWRDDEKRQQITIRHLLNFTSGLQDIDSKLHSKTEYPDKYATAVDCPCQTAPGKEFRYGSNHLMVFGELIRRKLEAKAATRSGRKVATDFVDYLEQHILEPIDCKHGTWLRDAKGNPALPYGAHMTAREWAKFGLLVLNRGKHKGRQIIPKKHFNECFEGSKANPNYGLNFWLIGKHESKRNKNIPADTVTAAGMFNQKLYIIPSKKLLVVRLGRTGYRKKRFDVDFLDALFGAQK